MHRVLICVVVSAFLLTVPSDACAVLLVDPAPEAITTDTPTLSWQRSAGEEVWALEIAFDPTLAADGSFRSGRFFPLASTQTSVCFCPHPLRAGRLFWHIESYSGGQVHWSEVRAFNAQDVRKPGLADFEIDYYRCLDQLSFSFSFSENTMFEHVNWRLDFFKRKRGKRMLRIRGTANDEDFGSVSEFRNRPHRLALGKRYLVRLTLSDQAGNQTRTGDVALRIERCPL